ncbi:MAG: TRAP transporter substrate-binding protein DctP [Enterocloster clostridioformis]
MTFTPEGSWAIQPNLQEAVIGGSIDIGTGMTTDLVDFIPSYAVFDMPNLFADVEQMRAVLSGDFVSALDEYNNQGGIEMLGFSDAGFRQLTSNKPVHQLADLSGQKIRDHDESVSHCVLECSWRSGNTHAVYGSVYGTSAGNH